MEQEQFNFKWQKRHIIIDHFSKSIMIQVGADNSGNLLWPEFQKIKRGDYAEYFPMGLDKASIEIRHNLGALIASGYKVKPLFLQGVSNDEHSVLLLTDIHEPKLTQFIER